MSLTALAFIGAYALALLSAFVVHPRWGLITYMAVFYLHPPMRWWGADLPEARWSLMAALVTLVALPQAKLPVRTAPFFAQTLVKLLLAYLVWMWIQVPWANPNHMKGLILFTKYFVLLYLFYRLVSDEESLKLVSMAHVLGCFYFGMLALDAEGTGRLEYIGGPGANDSNTLGMHVSTGLFFAGTLILTQRGWVRWLILLTVPVLTNCVLQTESRGAFLGAAMGGLAYLWLAPRRHKKFIVSLGVISLCVLLAYAPATYWERMSTLKAVQSEEEEIDGSSQSRIALAKAQLEMFADYPAGLGFDTTTYLSRDYLDTQWLTVARGGDLATQGARASHNTLLSVMTDQGLPGLLLAGSAIFTVFFLVRRLRRLDSEGLSDEMGLYRAAIGATLAAVFVSGMFTNYLKAEVQLWALALLLCSYEAARLQCAGETGRASDLSRTARHGGRGLPLPH